MTTSVSKFITDHPEWREHADLVIVPPNAEEAVEEFPDCAGSEVVRKGEEWTTFDVNRLAIYLRLRRCGQSHRFSEMIALQRPPQCMTDDVFFAGIPRLADQMTPQMLATRVAAAKRHGFTPPADSVYHSGLARFPGDPEAFVTRAMGRGYIRRLLEKRGWAGEGAVNVDARQPDSDPLEKSVPLASDLVNRCMSNMVRKNPSLKAKSRKELRDMAVDMYGPTR